MKLAPLTDEDYERAASLHRAGDSYTTDDYVFAESEKPGDISCPVCRLDLYRNPKHFDPNAGTSGLYKFCVDENLPQVCDMPDMLNRVEHRLNVAAHNSPFKSYEAEHYRAAWEWLMIRISYVPGLERNRHYEYYLPWVPEKAR